jgi:hypothetical protein
MSDSVMSGTTAKIGRVRIDIGATIRKPKEGGKPSKIVIWEFSQTTTSIADVNTIVIPEINL